jgi:hypothetical protein
MINSVFFSLCHYMFLSSSHHVRNQDICLYLTTPYDIVNDQNSIYWRMFRALENFLLFNQLRNSGSPYKIINNKVASVNEINQTIEKLISNGNKIHSLWILAHGSYDGISLTGGQHIDDKNLDQLKVGLQKIEPQATVVLAACSAGYTGYRLGHAQPIAAQIASIAPGSKVYAPTTILMSIEIIPYMSKSNRLKVRFFCPWTHENFTKKFIKSSDIKSV